MGLTNSFGSAARVGDRRGQAAWAWLMVMIVSYSMGVKPAGESPGVVGFQVR